MSETTTNEQTASDQENQYDEVEGFVTKSNKPRGLYLHIFDEGLCQKSKTPIEGWEGPVTTTNPRTKEPVHNYVFRYDHIIVRIIDANKYSREFDGGGKASGIELTLLAGSKRATLQLPWIDHPLKRFLKVAPNINFEKPIMISCFPKTTTRGNKAIAIAFNQGDSKNPEDWPKVEEYYGRDNPEVPEAIHDEMSDSWDYRDQEKFLGQKFFTDTMPKIKAIAANYPQFAYNQEQQLQQETVQQTQAPQQQQQQAFQPENQKATGQMADKPEDPIARNLTDLVTAKQLGMIRGLAKEMELDEDAVCKQVFNCSTIELSKTAASYLITYLQKNQSSAQPIQQQPPVANLDAARANYNAKVMDDMDDLDMMAPATAPVTKPTDDDIPF